MCRNILLFGLVILCGTIGIAQQKIMNYQDLKKEYVHFRENDSQALPFIRKSIAFAKKSQNVVHLLHAYEDAAFSTPLRIHKLKYADSCIQTAHKTKDPSFISMAYLGKGIVYYFNFRKFDKALDQYLLATKNAEYTENEYLKWRIKYQIGVVKSYLGYSKEALDYFKECLQFFEANLKKELHPDLLYNNTRGLLNTVHQMSICERQLHLEENAEKLLAKTLPYLNQPDFSQEKGYYLKEIGILNYQKGAYTEAIDNLLRAEPLLLKRKEDSHLSVSYFYLGNAYLEMKEWETAFSYYKKVDSLFSRNETVSVEVLETYERLLKNKNFPLQSDQRNHYIDQLLKANHTLQSDMPHLSSRIYFEYDSQILTAEKERLLQGYKKITDIQKLLVGVGGSMITFLILLGLRHRNVNLRYRQLQQELGDHTRKKSYGDDIAADLLKKLYKFEQKTIFLNPNLTLEKMAKLLGTNKNHLSFVLNEHRQITFYNYIASLRIKYITKLINSDPIYLKYTAEALADECGMSSRQQLLKFFLQFNDMSLTDFMEQKTKELPSHL